MTLGFICGGIHTPHFAEFASEALHEAERRNYHLLVSVTEWDPKKELQCIDTLLDGRVDGAIVSVGAIVPGTPQYMRIIESRFPIVLTENIVEGLASVFTDHRPGMNQAVELLKSLGHERIGYIRQSTNAQKYSFSKYTAFSSACCKHDIAVVDYQSGGLEMGGAIELGKKLGADKDIPRAFIVCSDYAAMGFIRGLRQAGLDVPKDIDVIGIDGTQWGQYSPLPLTSILQDRKQIASKAVDLLMEKINPAAAGDTDTPARRIMIPSRLIVRETTKKRKQQY